LKNSCDTGKRLVRLQDASEMLGVTMKTLRVWDKEGKIATVRSAGGHRRIPKAEIDRLLGCPDFAIDKIDASALAANLKTIGGKSHE